MNTATSQIVHESETQRQHVRLPLPATVQLEDQIYTIKDLSAGGVAIQNIQKPYRRGQRLMLRLHFPFSSFSLNTELEAEVQYHNQDTHLLGCAFVRLSAAHISLLNHILKAYLAGDILHSADIFSIVSRDNFVKTRKQKQNANTFQPKLGKQVLGLLTIGLIGLTLTGFILSNLYNSLFIVKANQAAVTTAAVNLFSPLEGVYHNKIDAGASLVESGQLLGIVSSVDGRATQDIKSPCKCYILNQSATTNSIVTIGAPLVSLAPLETKPVITAYVDSAQTMKIRPESLATITVYGLHKEYTGHVVGMQYQLSPAIGTTAQPAILTLETEEKLPVAVVNRPASVSFSVHP